MSKVCTNCKQTKSPTEFSKQKTTKDGLKCRCKACDKENRESNLTYHKEYYETRATKSKKYNKRDPNLSAKEINRNNHLMYKYKITQDDYNKMFEEQKGCCLICNKHQNKVDKPLNIDHSHASGKVRGLLCWECNVALGKFKDNISLLENAISYLQKYIY
jgi:hypothetical protein